MGGLRNQSEGFEERKKLLSLPGVEGRVTAG